MTVIKAQNLKKYYKTHSRKAGFGAALTSFFHRKYTTFKALDQVSFSVSKGEILGIIGANGAGKTTLLKCLIGLLYPTDSEDNTLEVLGYRPSKREKNFLIKMSIVLGQKNQLWWDLPAADSFELHRHIYSIPKIEFKNRLEELISILKVKDKIGTQVRRLSLGERMKMEIIAALLHGPELVLLDEPTIGLDLSAQNAMRKFIQKYNKSHQTTFLITSHYMRDIEELCPRVLFINEGHLLFDGPLKKLTTLVPLDDTLTAHVDHNLKETKNSIIIEKILEKHKARLSFDNQNLTCTVPHQHVGNALTFLAQNFALSEVHITASTMEETIRSIYQDPKKLNQLQSL